MREGRTQESKPVRVSACRTKQSRDAKLRHVAGVGRNLRWVRIVCWQLGDPSDGGRKDLAFSSLLSGSPPYGSPGTGVPVRSAVNHQPESRVREIRTHGSEGGGAGYSTGSSYPYPR